MNNMIAFRCEKCGKINVFNSNTADGRDCMECHRRLCVMGEAIVHGRNNPQVKANIMIGSKKVGVISLDDILEKLKEAERIHDKLGL